MKMIWLVLKRMKMKKRVLQTIQVFNKPICARRKPKALKIVSYFLAGSLKRTLDIAMKMTKRIQNGLKSDLF